MTTYRSDTRTLNALLTTTLDNYSSEMADTIFSSNFTYYSLKKKGCFRSQDGGAFMHNPVLFQVNSTAAWYDGYETIDTTPQDGMTDGMMPWASLAAAISISREEERKNSGRARLIGLLEKKIFQCEQSLIENLGTALFGVGRYNSTTAVLATKQMAGLRSAVPEDPTLYPFAGLDGANAWWQNKVSDNDGTSFVWTYDLNGTAVPTGVAKMRKLYNNCSKGAGGAPNLIIATQEAYEAYEGGLAQSQRFSSESSAAAGFDTLRFKGSEMSWDDKCTSASVAANTCTGSKNYLMYFLNTKFFEIMYDSQSLFAHEGFVRPENQTAKTSLVVFMGNMLVTNRRKHGILINANVTEINS
jgi:hypothetical protein